MHGFTPTAGSLRLATLALALASVLAAPGAATAQVRLFGHVIDNQTSEPIVGAQVILVDNRGRWVEAHTTTAAGEFDFTVKRDGAYRLRGSRLGYRDNTTPRLFLGEHSAIRVELRLDVDAILLAPLEIVARSPARSSPVLENYNARLKSGLGTFVTREQIERARVGRVTDVLATVSGIRLESAGGAGNRRVIYMRQACPAQVFIDGFLLNRPGASIAVDDVVSPGSVEGIEIYGGFGTVPAEFLNPNARCGVVAIWTRRGRSGGG